MLPIFPYMKKKPRTNNDPYQKKRTVPIYPAFLLSDSPVLRAVFSGGYVRPQNRFGGRG